MYALTDGREELLASGLYERIGQPIGGTTIKDASGATVLTSDAELPTHVDALHHLLGWLQQAEGIDHPEVVGHRVVHGGPRYTQPELVNETLVAELRRLSPFDLEHLPVEIDTLEAAAQAFPDLPQVACFDTAFHRAMPRTSQLLPLPRDWAEEGIVRYGFHGLSYAYIAGELAQAEGGMPGHVIIAHLGSGCSLAALKDGRPFTTTMGFTPTGGLMMGTRTGDLDPGLVLYLLKEKGLSPEEFNQVVNKKSGLLGVSGLSSDMRDLLAAEADNPAAGEAVTCFCQTARKYIAGLAAEMGGLDTLVFTAGVGEHSSPIRQRIVEGLGFLDLELDAAANEANSGTISTAASRVSVQVIPTNEELMIARQSAAVLSKQSVLASS